MPLNPPQRWTLEEGMRSKAIVRYLACGDSRWRFAQAAYLRALLEEVDRNLTEDGGVIKVCCDNCGRMLLFDAGAIGIRGLWDESRRL
jgi:hypothetical protein